ncbi:pyridoxamine 5'-phosphate oxidase family protein [Catenulispora sp. NF23]|uniref:pyridoxamine 5'-phosphate oxidase family protein n=1 Tax=Catenulispora pinistramenti TaxID=2705254 RepID=UPI001BA6972E|nr:pyridoxamine 5'-phosphate oxidase family protein [Catenulispora pinistramenti]MBS2539247.1 pyridoxamine 5'-phosphate oxidase family protein [Catenulispora pinistramenti]
MALSVGFEGTDLSSSIIAESVESIAAGTMVLSLATADAAGTPHANMAFFALGNKFDLYFVSEPSTRHGQNASARAQASAAIWLPPPEFGEGLRGMQVTGECGAVVGDDAEPAFEAYRSRFPSFGGDPAVRESYLDGTGAASLYRFRVERVRLVDEPHLGRRNYVELSVLR